MTLLVDFREAPTIPRLDSTEDSPWPAEKTSSGNSSNGDASPDVNTLPLLPSTHPSFWHVADICVYLQRRGLPAKLCSVLKESLLNDGDPPITGTHCTDLQDQDLVCMGIDNAFHRRRLLRELAHLCDDWPTSCDGWLDACKPSPPQWNLRKRVPWPPPPVRIRPCSAPTRGNPSRFVLWQRKLKGEKEEIAFTLAEVKRRTEQQAMEGIDTSDLNVLRDLFKKNTGRSTQAGGSAFFKRLSLVENPQKPMNNEQEDDVDGLQEEVRTLSAKHHLVQAHQRMKASMCVPESGNDTSRTSRADSILCSITPNLDDKDGVVIENKPSTPSRKSKRDKQLQRQRLGNRQPNQKKEEKEESKSSFLNRKSTQILADAKEDEAEMQMAFKRYSQNGRIHRKDLWYALADMGLTAKTRSGKQVINQCFATMWQDFQEGDDKAMSPQEAMVSFDFAVVHVQEVRKVLSDQLRKDMMEHFEKADDDHSGVLDVDEILNALAAFELCPRDDDELNDLLCAINTIDRDGNGIDFEEFLELASRVRGHLNAQRRRQQRIIATQARLTDKMFFALRSDIIDLHKAFNRYDSDGSGYLEGCEITPLLLDIGLAPQNSAQRLAFQERLDDFMDQNGYIHLPAFFRLCHAQRMIFEAEWREKTHALFRSCDKDNNNFLDAQEVGQVLVKLGLHPRSKAEQTEIGDIVEEADIDGSGTIDLAEFEMIVHRVDVKLRAMQRDRDAEFASALGFSQQKFNELREVYEELEDMHQKHDGSHSLMVEMHQTFTDGFDISGLRLLVNKMRKPVTSNALRSIFEQLDEDNSGCIGILQFLQFMWLMENDAFDGNTGNIAQWPPIKHSRQERVGDKKATYEKEKDKQKDRARADRVFGRGATLVGTPLNSRQGIAAGLDSTGN